MKKCTKCGIEKPLSEFYKSSKSKKDGLVSSCKQCRKACSSAHYQKNRDLTLEKQKIYREQNKERIREKQKQYGEDNRDVIANRKKNYCETNKTLIAEKNKEFRKRHIKRITEAKKLYCEKNKASILQKNAEYRRRRKKSDPVFCLRCKAYNSADYQKNRELKLEKQKIYREQNRERIKARSFVCKGQYKERIAQYQKHRRKSDPVFYLSCKIRRLISLALQNKGYTKRSRTHEILGCSFIEFKEHLEKQFVNGLSWENRSEWHIDHVIPLASAKTEEEVIRLNHYTNLQPLWAADNLKKRDKMPDLA